ncbi:helix-turn-helix domain-containing protein [Sphingobacterium sp. UT-1RO-CII-1]|uniref:helix-turn-helix transcriptional regulator n=1 Tax=Sphingobacterium sp. UT-1RO-CII-1 TaxID=2995225 RepID=UPI00227B8907|nr:helix-turn-helix domain-containing protein [Sphingobacterium sp. UT-1RO-CII-1]MCY4779065.1 helix-turn-helix domain-containing protein [Sphingobacterium sp. UT-1RO-CII-1]
MMNRHDALNEILAYMRQVKDCMVQIRDCVRHKNTPVMGVEKPAMCDQQLLDMEEVLSILRISRSTYYRFVNTGKLVPRKIGERHCYYLEDLEDMIEESKRRGRI